MRVSKFDLLGKHHNDETPKGYFTEIYIANTGAAIMWGTPQIILLMRFEQEPCGSMKP